MGTISAVCMPSAAGAALVRAVRPRASTRRMREDPPNVPGVCRKPSRRRPVVSDNGDRPVDARLFEGAGSQVSSQASSAPLNQMARHRSLRIA